LDVVQKRRDVYYILTSLANFSPDFLLDDVTLNFAEYILQFCGPHLITKIKYYAVDFESRDEQVVLSSASEFPVRESAK